LINKGEVYDEAAFSDIG